MSDNIDIKLFKAWRNIVINKVIFKYASLYKQNQCVEFDYIESLRQYGEREYITKLIYKHDIDEPSTGESEDQIIKKGDLPEYGALKEVDLSRYELDFTSGDIIPAGVEILHFSKYSDVRMSELPSSINTITNLSLKQPYKYNKIPNNITSLSFCRDLDPNQFYDIKLPSSIKTLDLGLSCSKVYRKLPSALPSNIPLSVTDLTTIYSEELNCILPTIPSSVTKLQLKLIDGDNIQNTVGNGQNFHSKILLFPSSSPEMHSKEVIGDNTRLKSTQKKQKRDIDGPRCFLPSSITKLQLKFNGVYQLNQGFVPSNVKELTIIGKEIKLRMLSINSAKIILLQLGYDEITIDKLNRWQRIDLLHKRSDCGVRISEGSLPPSITKLSIYGMKKQNVYEKEKSKDNIKIEIKPNSIPSSVVDLELCFENYPKSFKNLLPINLTRLVLYGFNEDRTKFLSELPLSLKYLKLNGKEIDMSHKIK